MTTSRHREVVTYEKEQSQNLNPTLSSSHYLLLRTSISLMLLAARGGLDMKPAFAGRDRNETKSSPIGSESHKQKKGRYGGAELWGGNSISLGGGKLGSSSQGLPSVT